MTLFCFVLQSKIRDAWWISTNWHKQREHQAVSQTINWNLSPPYVVTQTHWLAGSQLIGRWKANEASMQETQKEGVFWYHRVKLELTATGCFYCQEVYLGLKAIWFKGDKAVKSYQTEKTHLPWRIPELPCLHRLTEWNGMGRVLLLHSIPGTSGLLAIAGNRVVRLDKLLTKYSDPLSCYYFGQLSFYSYTSCFNLYK